MQSRTEINRSWDESWKWEMLFARVQSLVLYIYYTANTTVNYNYLFQNSLKKDFEAREMVQLLRGHAALAEDLKSVPRTYIRQFTAACTSSCRGIWTFGLYGHVNICACTHTQTQMNIYIYVNSKSLNDRF